MHPKTIRISVAPYLNSRPFLYGIKRRSLAGRHRVETDVPSVCAQKMESGRADVGLLPVAALDNLRGSKIISRYCIGAEREIKSVMLFSKVPMADIRRIFLDYQSVTSVKLLQILAVRLWKIVPVFLTSEEGYEQKIHGNTAGLVIGDRALLLRGHFPFEWDLAEAWHRLTSLPFVFACWVTRNTLPAPFMRSFEDALQWGVEHRREVVPPAGGGQPLSPALCLDYLTHCVSYSLDGKKRMGMKLFMEYQNSL